MFFPRVFGMFLLEFYIGRRNLFADLGYIFRCCGACSCRVSAGLPLAYFGVRLEGNNMGVPASPACSRRPSSRSGCQFLAGLRRRLALLFHTVRGLRHAFAPAGQMALTVDLLHSVAAVIVFMASARPLRTRSARGGARRRGRVLVLFDHRESMWLAVAAFGPAEWLWRMFTYRRRVPCSAEVRREKSFQFFL